jgi:hypothetical protein
MLLFQLFFLTIFNGSLPELTKNSFLTFHSNEFFYTVDSDSVYVTTKGDLLEKWAHQIEWPHFNFKAINRSNEVILISDGGGVLYRFKDRFFERVDKSFEHRNKYRSNDFTFENKIFSYGGYGLFNVNPNLTFFNESNKEWSEFFYHPNYKSPPPRQLAIAQVKDSFFYVGGGTNKIINQQLDLVHSPLDDFWKLDLNTHSWEFLGSLNEDFFNISKEVLFLPETVRGAYKGGCLAIFRGKVFWLDISNNSVKEFNDVNPILLEGIEFIDFNPSTNLFMFSKLIHNSNKYRFVFMTPSELLGDSVTEHQLYTIENKNELYFFSLILVFVIIFGVYLKTKTKSNYSIILANLNSIQKELSLEEFSILNQLIKDHPKAVSFPSILSFFEPNLSYESRVKKLRLSILRIDDVLKTYTKSKNSILKFRQNQDDRRIKEVYIH